MLKRAGLATAAALIALTAGCTTSEHQTTTTPAPAATTTPTTTSTTAPTSAPTSAPAKAVTARPVIDKVDWKRFVEPCQSPQKVLIQKVVTGDVNGDGAPDTLVAHACSAITSYWPTVVEAFDGSSPAARPQRLGTMLTDVAASDVPYLVTLEVKNGTVQIQAYGVDVHTTQACPRTEYTYGYKYSGGNFQRLTRTARNVNHCLRIEY